MKNLKLSLQLISQINLQSTHESILFSAFDIERNRLFFASSDNIVYVIHLSSSSSSQNEGVLGISVSHVEVEPLDLKPGDYITAMDYLMEKEAVIVGTLNGYLLLHIEDGNATEVVGKVEGGVRNISPSPDGALLAVITGLGQILVMTSDWDVLYENTIKDVLEDTDVRDPIDNALGSSICWRGDGKYFVTLTETRLNSSSQKKIKIWERDSGALHASSDLKAFMGVALDWMPSGAKIVAAQDRKAENQCPLIKLFERNGLERSSFSIGDQVDGTVEILKWNCNSDLLAALVKFEEYDAVKIWSFSNNHWYLKQEMRYPREDGVKFMWDPRKPLRLICWNIGGKITTYNFVWMTAVTENSTALVIDNSNILISPLYLSLMPPPMCMFSLKFPNAVREIAFFSQNTMNQLAALLSDGSLFVVELPDCDTWEELEGKHISVESSCSQTSFDTLSHLVWLDSHSILGVQCTERGYCLQEIKIVCSEDRVMGLVTSSGWSAVITNELVLEQPVIGVAPNPAKKSSAFIQFDGGNIVEYTLKMGSVRHLSKDLDCPTFSSSCPWMNVATFCENGVTKPLFFGLDCNNRLHASGKIISTNCTSYSFYSNSVNQLMTHLIITTKQDLLFVIGVDDVLHGNLEIKYEKFIRAPRKFKEENGESINVWERGAKVVGILHGDEAAVLLQTIRGNLECIYPRKLVLESIFKALVQKRYKDGLVMVRRHRIDFNVIIDHCGWEVFLHSAAEFVRQINNLSYITEFVCSIKNEDVMQTLYKNIVAEPCLKDTEVILNCDLPSFDGKGKISCVLLAIRKALEEQVPASPARELCILTTLARSEPPALEDALKRVKVIREMEILASSDLQRKTYPSAEEALKHLLWLADTEAVYEVALGLYDLKLSAIVALNSQKDPKEFLPFLQGLERMSPAIMKYSIDLKLKRYQSALRHLVSAGTDHYEDCMNLIKNNPQLFTLGVQLFTDPFKRSQILEAWGDHLNCEKEFEDAAKTYLCCFSLEKALKSYRACGNWKGVLTVAGLLKMSKEETLLLANELCEELQALGKPVEAAKIALEYCGDVASGIGFFINAREWEDAIRVGLMHMRNDLISEVETASVECAISLVGEYDEGLQKVGKYLTRYLAVRQRRLVLAAKLQSEESLIDDVPDDSSETSSTFSEMSAYTMGTKKGSRASISSAATSKRAQRQQRKHKGGRIRAGSPGEELALVEHLKSMSLTSGAQRELKSILIVLLMLGKEETAKKLQRAAENFQLSHMAAVKLAEDIISSANIDEKAHTLEHYLQKLKEDSPPQHEAFSWRSKVLSS